MNLIKVIICLICIGVQSLVAEEQKEEFYWKNRVYLATFPRSGNHWMRYLIEEATGLATSSVYQDGRDGIFSEHMPIIFPWGGYCSDHGYEGNANYPSEDDIVVVKTHLPIGVTTKFDHLPYNLTIRIIRHPVDVIYAHYIRYCDWQLPRNQYKNGLRETARLWRVFQEYWDNMPNVLTIRYEDLFKDQKNLVEKILHAAGYRVSEEDVERAIKRYPPTGASLKHLYYFNEEDLEIIQNELKDAMQRFGYSINEIKEWVD